MPLYHFKAYSIDRNIIQGMIYCESTTALYDTLKSKNLTLLKKKKHFSFKHSISLNDLKEWCYFCKTLLYDGISIKDTLLTSLELSESIVLKEILYEVIYDIELGSKLSEAIKKHEKKLGSICVSTFSTAEKAGNIANAFENLEEYYSWRITLKKNITTALRYPLFILSFVFLMMIGLQVYLVPELLEFFKAQGSIPTSLHIWLNLCENWPFFIFPTLFFLLFMFKFNKILPIDVLINYLPFGKLLYTLDLVKFMATFSLMIKSHIDLRKALAIAVSEIQFLALKKKLLQIDDHLKNGLTLSAAFAKIPYIDKLVPRFITLGEKAGDLSQHLGLCGDILTKKSLNRIQQLVQIIQPLLISLIGLLLLWIVTTLMTPIYNQLPELTQ